MPKKIVEKEKNKLTPGQETFFLIGHTWGFIHDRDYPFQDEAERARLWQRWKNYLIGKCHESRRHGDFCAPGLNQLRPAEYFERDAPEEKKVFYPDGEPGLEETDCEFLQRHELLTDEDRTYMQTEDFKFQESQDLEFRVYMQEQNDGNL